MNNANPVVRVEITAEPVKTGRPYTTKEGRTGVIPDKQSAYIHQGAAYPVATEVEVPTSGPYKPGMYLMAGNCFEIRGSSTGYAQLGFSGRNLSLVPVEDALAMFNGGEVVALKTGTKG